MKKFFLNLVTEPNNKTFCPVRLIAIAGAVQYLAMGFLHLFRNAAFDPQSYGVGFAALLSGIGVALGLKKDSPTEGQ